MSDNNKHEQGKCVEGCRCSHCVTLRFQGRDHEQNRKMGIANPPSSATLGDMWTWFTSVQR